MPPEALKADEGVSADIMIFYSRYAIRKKPQKNGGRATL